MTTAQGLERYPETRNVIIQRAVDQIRCLDFSYPKCGITFTWATSNLAEADFNTTSADEAILIETILDRVRDQCVLMELKCSNLESDIRYWHLVLAKRT
jgi:hypothetical protein